MKKNFKLLMLTLIMGGGLFASEAMALEQKDGVYQIGTPQDWADFCKLNNETNTYWKGKAVMTADVTVDGNIMVGINGDYHPFEGVFDGQGHTLTIDYKDLDENCVAPFRRINGATIKNLRVDGTITVKNGKQFAAGIVGGIWGSHGDSRILNCISNVTIKDDANHDGTHGGIVGYCQEDSYTLIEKCAFTGVFEAPNVSGCGGIIGWARNDMFIKDCYVSASISVNAGDIIARSTATVYNCYYVNQGNMSNEKNAIQVQSEEVSSGELCFKLNDRQSDAFVAWHQTVGSGFPVPFGSSIVYPYSEQGIQCNGWGKNGSTITFKNTKDCSFDEHNYNDYGFCQTYYGDNKCDHQQPDFMTPVDGYYEIANNKQLNWFAVKVNQRNLFLNAKLTADIDNYGNGPMIGVDNDYSGIFDGQNHTITIGFTHNYGNVGLFRNIRKATIKNLKVDGSITNNSYQIGGLVSVSRGKSAIENVIVGANISSTHSGDGTHGGVIAVAYDVPTIKNVGFVGSIIAENDYGTCGIIGYAHSGGSITYENCYVTGTMTLGKNGNDDNNRVFGRHDEKCVNCYTTLDRAKTSNDEEKFRSEDNNGTVTTDYVESGELCFLLNGSSSDKPVWHQTLGSDNYPVPFSTGHMVVYYHTDFYANINKDDDNNFQIANADDLKAFAYTVNNGNPNIKGKLTSDIDFTGISGYPGIGKTPNYFSGVFDGQGHKISHLAMNTGNGIGLFGDITSKGIGENATVIKNITIDGTCSFSGGQGVAGIAGACIKTVTTSEVQFLQCGNEASVNANTSNAGGILGVNYFNDGYVRMTLINCYNTGNITGTTDNGGLSGWLGNSVTMSNCYNTGSVGGNNSDAYCRWEGSYVPSNCFSLNGGIISTSTPSTDFQNGTVFAALFDYNDNENNVDGSVWQMEFSGTPHPVLYDAALVMKEDFPNRPKDGRTGDVTLYRTTKIDTWNTFCAPFDMNTTQMETMFGANAKVVELTSGDENLLHFTTISGNIEAGKAYLVKPSEAKTSVTISGVTISDAAPSTSTFGGYAFTGVYSPTSLPQDAYVFTTKKPEGTDVIIKVNAGTNMNGFRAYLKATSSNARATSFVIDEDGTTGIITATGDVIENGKMYNLGGQRVKEPQRGLYIVNGKKYIK